MNTSNTTQNAEARPAEVAYRFKLKSALLDLGTAQYEQVRQQIIFEIGYEAFRDMQNSIFKEIGTIKAEKLRKLSMGERLRRYCERILESTPGPWKADKWATGWTVSAPDSHYSVCHLQDCNNAEANASLIAAAPELLTACNALLACVEAEWGADFVPYNLGIEESKQANDAVTTARAAILKAEKEQS